MRYLLISTALHASLLITLPTNQQPAQQQSAAGQHVKVDIVDSQAGGTMRCERTYVGVGVMVGSDGRIAKIAAGSPAARAGIQIGDTFEPRSSPRGKLGGEVIIDVERAGKRLIFTVNRAIICEGI